MIPGALPMAAVGNIDRQVDEFKGSKCGMDNIAYWEKNVTPDMDMAPDYLRHDKLYDIKQDIWIDAVKMDDQYIADPARSPSSETFVLLSLHFVSDSNIAALIMALTAFKVGRYDLIRAPSAFRILSIRAQRQILRTKRVQRHDLWF